MYPNREWQGTDRQSALKLITGSRPDAASKLQDGLHYGCGYSCLYFM